MMQLDLQKAYDMVDWRSLDHILQEFGFPSRFIMWITTVVKTISYKFNVNVTYTRLMQARRGIRQEYSIPPTICFGYVISHQDQVIIGEDP